MCILCQQTSPKCLFGNRTMTSFCDVTNSAHQIQMTTLCHWMKPPPWKVSAYATASTSGFTIIYQLFFWVLASGPPAVARTVDPFSEVCSCLKTLITPLNVTYIFSEKETALGLPQLGLRFLADSNSWDMNGKSQNCETDPQEYWASWLLTMFLHSPAYIFQLDY